MVIQQKIILYLSIILFVSCSQGQVIAEVNGKKISLNDFKKELAKLPENLRKGFENDYPGFLDELIDKELLLQEAKQKGVPDIKEVAEKIKQNKNNKEDIIIEELIKIEVLPKAQVSEQEVHQYYKENTNKMQGSTYDQIKPQVQAFLLQQKQQAVFESYVAELRTKAKIKINEKWLKQETAKLKNPMIEALQNKLPTMVDFGSNSCIPCIQMKPIIEELQKELKDKANILLIDVGEHQVLTRKYKIMLIPTQIFFDTLDSEIFRHIGFFSKDSIISVLKKAGLEQ